MNIKSIIIGLKKDLVGEIGKQTLLLYLSQILALILGIFTSVVNTRALGADGYGILSFFLTITSFTVLFFRFGFFSSSGLLIAQTKDEAKMRELIGASVVIGLLIGLFYSAFIFLLSFFVDELFRTDVGWIFRWAAFMLIAFPLTLLIPQIGRGTNEIEKLSLYNIFSKVLYLLGALILLKAIQVKPFHFILLNVIATTVGVFIIISLFSPVFRNIWENLKIIWKKNKEYGFHLYLGQIANQSTYQLDRIFISYFVNTTQLGFYTLAMAITMPMAGLSQALSVSLFRRFVEMERIPKKVIWYNFLWLASCVIGLAIFGRYIVILLFTEEFLPVVPLILPLALASFFQGMYQPYNMFLVSKERGKWLRNISFSQSLFNIGGNLVFVYFLGAWGAAIASAIAAFVAYLGHIYYYSRYTKVV